MFGLTALPTRRFSAQAQGGRMNVFVATYTQQRDTGILSVHSSRELAEDACFTDAREFDVLEDGETLTWRQNADLDEWFATVDDETSYEINLKEVDPTSFVIEESP